MEEAGLEEPLVVAQEERRGEKRRLIRGCGVVVLVFLASFAVVLSLSHNEIFTRDDKHKPSREADKSNVKDKKPNFLVFLVDDMGYGDLACFGRTNVSTPHVDAIAKEGVKFTQWMSAAAICTPSRAAFQTGKLPVRLGMVANSLPFRVYPLTASTGGIPEREETIAQALGKIGYRTGMSGKWHLGISSAMEKYKYLPKQKGYDSWLGIPFTNMHKCKEVPQGGEGKLFCMLMANNTIIQQPLVEQNLTRALTHHAVHFISEAARQQIPFFFVFSFLHVHTPLFTSPEFKNRSQGGEFGDNVEEMDHAVGVVMAALKESQVDDNTLVILTSDNGPFAEEGYDKAGRTGGLKGSKGQTYEGGIRMPAVARWPGKIQAGIVTDQLVGTMDIFPTLLSLAGENQTVQERRELDGRDLSGLLRDPSNGVTPHKFMFHYCGHNLAAVRMVWGEKGERVFKYHFLTPKWKTKGDYRLCTQCCPFGTFSFGGNGGSLCDCRVGLDLVKHQDPVVYDMTTDKEEQRPLTPETFPYGEKAYQDALTQVKEEIAKHKKTVVKVKDQMFGLSPFNFPCCKGNPIEASGCICDYTHDGSLFGNL